VLRAEMGAAAGCAVADATHRRTKKAEQVFMRQTKMV